MRLLAERKSTSTQTGRSRSAAIRKEIKEYKEAQLDHGDRALRGRQRLQRLEARRSVRRDSAGRPEANGRRRVSRRARRQSKTRGPQAKKPPRPRAREFLDAGKPKDAERNFRRVLSRAPDDTPALEGLVRALTREGRMDESREQAVHLAALDPKNPIALILAGHSGRPQPGAVRAVGKAGTLGKGPGSPEDLSKRKQERARRNGRGGRPPAGGPRSPAITERCRGSA